MKNIQIGKNLKTLRLMCNLTQTDIAKVLEVTTQQYQKYETGGCKISISKMVLLWELFIGEGFASLTFEDLLGRDVKAGILNKLK